MQSGNSPKRKEVLVIADDSQTGTVTNIVASLLTHGYMPAILQGDNQISDGLANPEAYANTDDVVIVANVENLPEKPPLWWSGMKNSGTLAVGRTVFALWRGASTAAPKDWQAEFEPATVVNISYGDVSNIGSLIDARAAKTRKSGIVH